MARLSTYKLILVVLVVFTAALLAIMLSMQFSQQYQQAERASLKASTITVGLSTFDIVEYDPGVFEGLRVWIEVVRFQVPPQSIDSILANDTQLTVLPVELAAVTMLRGGDVYIVALDNYMNQAIIARPDSGIEDPSDLRGKTVAAVVGSGTYALFKSFMKQLYNITVDEENPDRSDLKVINVRPGEALTALLKGDADAAVIWDPIVSLAVSKHGMRIVASYRDLWRQWIGGDSEPPMLVWIARGEIVRDKQLLEDVLEVHRRAAIKWNSDREYTVKLLVKLYNLDPDVAEMVWERNQMYTGPCITLEQKQAMVKIWELAYQAGYLKEMPSPDRIVSCEDLGID